MDSLGLSEETIGWIVRIFSATLIFIVGIWLAYYVSKLVRRKAAQHPRIDTTLGAFFSLVIRYAIMILVVLIVLQQFGVQITSLVAVLGASALAVGLALQGTLTNVASGIMIAFLRPYQIGDYVELNGKEGKVIDLDLFFTKLLSGDSKTILIPNSQTVSNPIVNFTRDGMRRCSISIKVGHDDDVDQALAIMQELALADPRALAQPEPDFSMGSMDEYGVTVQAEVSVATDDHDNYRNAVTKELKRAFDHAGIEIARRNPAAKPSTGSVTINKS